MKPKINQNLKSYTQPLFFSFFSITLMVFLSRDGKIPSASQKFILWVNDLRNGISLDSLPFADSPFATPLWLAWLRLIAKLPFEPSTLFLKAPALIATVLYGALAWFYLKNVEKHPPLSHQNLVKSLVTSTLFFLCPGLIYNSAVMGEQLALVVLGSLCLIVALRMDRFLTSGLLLGLLLNLSPVSFSLVPYFVFHLVKKRKGEFLKANAALFISALTLWKFLGVGTGSHFDVLASAGDYNVFALLGMNYQRLSDTTWGVETVWLFSFLILSSLSFVISKNHPANEDTSLLCGATLTILTTLLFPGLPSGSALVAWAFAPFIGYRNRRALYSFLIVAFMVSLEMHNHHRTKFDAPTMLRLIDIDPLQLVSPMILFSVLFKLFAAWNLIGSVNHPVPIEFPTLNSLSLFTEWLKQFATKFARSERYVWKRFDYVFLLLLLIFSLSITFHELGQRDPYHLEGVPANSKLTISPKSKSPINALWVMKSRAPLEIQITCLGSARIQSTQVTAFGEFGWTFRNFAIPCEKGFDIQFATPPTMKNSSPERVYGLMLQNLDGEIPQEGTICYSETCQNIPEHPLFSHRLKGPPNRQSSALYDEEFNIKPGISLIQSPENFKIQSTHPLLGRMFIALSMKRFGISTWASRLPTAIVGALIPLLVFILAASLFPNRSVAITASLLSLFDNLRLTMARMAVIEPQLNFWVLLTQILLIYYIRQRLALVSSRLRSVCLFLLLAIAFGSSIATKWSGAFSLPLIAFGLVLVHLNVKRSKTTWILESIGLFVIPALIYFAAYIPFLLSQGLDAFLGQFSSHQKAIMKFQTSTLYFNPESIQFSAWPFLNKSNMYLMVEGLKGEDLQLGFLFGNPLIWWAILPAFGWLFYRKLYKEYPGVLFVALGFVCHYFVWIFIRRPTFLYHFLNPSVLGLLAISLAVNKIRFLSRFFRITYLFAVCVSFLWFLPLTQAKPITEKRLQLCQWFDSWFIPLRDRDHFKLDTTQPLAQKK